MEKMGKILHHFNEIFSVDEWQYEQLLWEFQGSGIGGGCFSVSLMSFISVTEAMSRMVDRVVMGGFLKGFITAVGCAGTISTSH